MTCSKSDYEYLRQLVLRKSANVLDPSRDYLFESRLRRLLRDKGLSSLKDLVASLRMRPSEDLQRTIAETMTINETSFFRDLRPFELMRLELLPELIEKRSHSRTLRFWSAACASGQEAYSLAILLREFFPQLADWRVSILGTDLSAEMVEKARGGRYSRIEMSRGLPAKYIVKYFVHEGEDWRVAPAIQSMCTFRQANLCDSLRFLDRFDGILLRNVMLYFSAETRNQLLANVHRLMPSDGFLILGASEQPAQMNLWGAVLSHDACYYRPGPAV